MTVISPSILSILRTRLERPSLTCIQHVKVQGAEVQWKASGRCVIVQFSASCKQEQGSTHTQLPVGCRFSDKRQAKHWFKVRVLLWCTQEWDPSPNLHHCPSASVHVLCDSKKKKKSTPILTPLLCCLWTPLLFPFNGKEGCSQNFLMKMV